MTLYIDLGNSNLKIGYIKDKKMKINTISTSFDKKEIENILLWIKKDLKEEKIEKALISSVNNEKNPLLLSCLNKEKTNVQFINFASFTKQQLTAKKIKNTAEVGSDILLNAFYVAQNYNSAIVVSLGTATVISKILNKNIEGVTIMPGIELSLKSLVDNASMIEDFKLVAPKSELGLTTQNAISSGILNGSMYAIEGFLKEINKEKLAVIFTGGNSQYLKKTIEKYSSVDDMVIKALHLWDQQKIV
ncbi:type III pantothenate kinase [Mycoplasma procyoni]|uniref:type III pantothenate kinase n=1 Tax=Mycoplasma procyoni TaxID=568784 RepID=UPI00197C0741|nr:type III pantothenate kinase [Mycoplasma procyoni]MBN3535088.1 type III pantothenate kinase [Mycoplasma procyoni]